LTLSTADENEREATSLTCPKRREVDFYVTRKAFWDSRRERFHISIESPLIYVSKANSSPPSHATGLSCPDCAGVNECRQQAGERAPKKPAEGGKKCEIDDQILVIILSFNRIIYNTFLELSGRREEKNPLKGAHTNAKCSRPNIDLS
jgi:hypothetical protein